MADNDILGYQAERKSALRSQLESKQQEYEANRKLEASNFDQKRFKGLIGESSTDAITQGRDKGSIDNISANLDENGAELAGKVISSPIRSGVSLLGSTVVSALNDKGKLDLSFMRDDKGNYKPEYIRQVMDLAEGDPNKFAAVHQSILENKVKEHDEAPAIAAHILNSALDYLHDNSARIALQSFGGVPGNLIAAGATEQEIESVPVAGSLLKAAGRAPYYAATGAVSGVKAAVKTGIALGHVMQSAAGMLPAVLTNNTANANDELINDSNQKFEAATKGVATFNDRATNEGEASFKTLRNDPLAFVDGLTGEASRLTGLVMGLGPMAGNGRTVSTALEKGALKAEMNAALLGRGSMWANTPANRMFTGLSKAINGIEQTRLPVYLDNLVSTMRMFGPSMYADYYSDLRSKGYSEEDAQRKALVRTGIANAAMSLANWAGPGAKDALNKLPAQVLNGVDREASKTFLSRLGELGKTVMAKADPRAATLGGIGMGTSAFMDGWQDHQDKIESGEIPQDTPFDAGAVMPHVAEAVVIGTASMGMSHLIGGHGTLPETPQATALYSAVADQKGFNAAIYRQVQKGVITPETGAGLQGLVERIAPHVLSFSKDIKEGKMSPERAVQIAVERARLEETGEAIAALGQQIQRQKTVQADGTATEKILGMDATGTFTEEGGQAIVAKMADLQAKAAASETAIRQATEGSYTKGRTLSGNEVLQLTANYTPEGGLSTAQARRIISEGPYFSDTQDISHFANDPEVARDILMMQNAGDVIAFADARNELARERYELMEPHTEKKAVDGTVIREASAPSEETAKKLTELDQKIGDLDKRYPHFSNATEGGVPVQNRWGDIANFKPLHANAPIIAADGTLIDGRKRIAYALANGQTTMEVVKPRPFEQVAKEVREEHDNTLGEAIPDTEGITPEAADVFVNAVEAYEQTMEQQGDAAAATLEAAKVLHEAGADIQEAAELLQKVTGHTINESQAEAFINVASGAKQEAMPEAPKQEQPITPRETYQNTYDKDFSILEESPLWDKETAQPREGITDAEVSDFMLLGEVPERLRSAEEVAPVAEATPEPAKTTVEHTTSTGNRVFVDEKGIMQVVNKNGEPVSENTRRKAILEAAEVHDFTRGEDAKLPEESENWTDREHSEFIAENSNNPAELAAEWLYAEREGQSLSSAETAIVNFGGFTTNTESFARFGDRNNLNNALARTYLNEGKKNPRNKGGGLDQIAEEISANQGVEVTEQDLVDFMLRFPSGVPQAERTFLPSYAETAAARFKDITGFTLAERTPTSKKIAEIALAQSEAKYTEAEKQFLENEYESAEELQREYERAIAEGVIEPVGQEDSLRPREADVQTQEEVRSQPASEAGVEATGQSNESPVGRAASQAGEQASIVRGKANILVPTERLEAIGWSKKGVNALGNRLRKAFGEGTTVAIIDAATAKELSGRNDSDAWYDKATDTIYLNVEGQGRRDAEGKRSGITPSMLLHESGHLWRAWAEKAAPELHAKGMDLARQSDAYKYMEALHDGLKADRGTLSETEAVRWKKYVDAYKSRPNAKDAYADEVLAHGIQEAGKAFVGEKDLKTNFGKWLQEFWTQAKAALGFKSLTTVQFASMKFGDFTNRVANEIGSGKELTRQIKEAVAVERKSQKDIAEEANFAAEAADRLDIAADGKKPIVLNEEAEASEGAKSNPAAQRLVSRISPSDILPAIEGRKPELFNKLLEAVKGTSLYAAKGGEEAIRAESVLLDIIDNPRSLSSEDREVIGGIVNRRGSSHLTGLVGELFNEVHSIIEQAAPDSGIRAIDIADAFAHNAQVAIREEKAREERSRKAKDAAGDVKFSISDSADKSAFIATLRDAAEASITGGNPFGSEAYKILKNAYEDGILNREEVREFGRRLTQAQSSPEAMREYVDGIEKMIGGEAVPEPVAETVKSTKPSPTSIKNRIVDEHLEELGLQPAMKSAAYELGDVWQEALERLDKDPTASHNLLNELRQEVRPLRGYENALLLHLQIGTRVQQRQLAGEVNRLAAIGDSVELGAAQARLGEVMTDLQDIYRLGREAGTENSKGLNTRKLMVNEDYSLEAMIERERSVKGGRALSEKEMAEITELHKKLEAKEAEIEELKKRKATDKVGEAFEQAKRTISRKPGEVRIKKEDILAAARARMAARKGIKPATDDTAMFALSDEPIHPEALELKGEIKELVRYYLEEGYKDREEILNMVHTDLLDIVPELTRRDIGEAFSEYGKVKEPSKDEVEKALMELKAQERLVLALEDAEGGRPPKKSGFQFSKPSDTVRELRRKVVDAMKEAGIEITDPSKQLASQLTATENRLRNEIADLTRQILNKARDTRSDKQAPTNEIIEGLKAEREAKRNQLDAIVGKKTTSPEQRVQIAIAAVERSIKDLQRKIDTGDLSVAKKGSNTPQTPELIAAREKQAELRAELEALRELANPKRTAEEIALDKYKKAIQKRMDEMQERIRTGNFDKTPKKALDLDSEAAQLTFERDKIKNEFDKRQEQYKLSQRSTWEKAKDLALDVWNVPKGLRSTLDLSAVGRQGAILAVGNPKEGAVAFGEMLKQAISEKRADMWLHALHESSIYPLMKQSKLYIGEPSVRLLAREEQFLSRLPERIPLYKHVYKASERAYTGFLNKIRADVFAKGVEQLRQAGITPENNLTAYKQLADFINNATGRGDLGGLERSAGWLNIVMFSPRNVASRIQLLNPVKYAKMNPEVRKIAARNMLQFTAFGMSMLTLAALAGAEVDEDPTSADFGKIKIGDTRYDLWAGEQQVIRPIAKVIVGTKNKAVEYSGGPKTPKGKDPITPIGRFARSKLSPALGTLYNIAEGEDMVGNKVTPWKEIGANALPLYVEDMYEVINDKKASNSQALQIAVPAFFGIGVQRYPERKK